jgi:hypothetical protein
MLTSEKADLFDRWLPIVWLVSFEILLQKLIGFFDFLLEVRNDSSKFSIHNSHITVYSTASAAFLMCNIYR